MFLNDGKLKAFTKTFASTYIEKMKEDFHIDVIFSCMKNISTTTPHGISYIGIRNQTSRAPIYCCAVGCGQNTCFETSIRTTKIDSSSFQQSLMNLI